MRWLAWILLCAPCLLQAEEARLPRVALLPFGWAEDAGRDVYRINLPGWGNKSRPIEAMDAALWQHLPTAIKAEWVERGQIRQMLEEQEIRIFSSGNALRAGRWLKADVVLTGIIKTAKQSKDNPKEYWYLDLSVVDLSNGEILSNAVWKPESAGWLQPWSATDFERLNSTCADLLKKGLENRRTRQPLPQVVPLFFRNTSDVERLNFWEDRLFSALSDKLPARVPVRVLLFPGVRETRQEQELSILGLTDADPDAWKKVGDYFIWGEYAEKNPDKPTEFQDTEVTFTWNFWDGGGVLVTKTESFRVSEAPEKLGAWLEEIAALVKGKHTGDKAAQNLERVHALLMGRVREILQPRGKDDDWIGQCVDRDWRGFPVEEKRVLYGLQLLDLAAFFKPDDPGCQLLRLAAGLSSNQELCEFLDRFSGNLSGPALVYQGLAVRRLGHQQAEWKNILDREDSPGGSGLKTNYDKEQRAAVEKHLNRWKTESARWLELMEAEKKAGRPIPELLVRVNLDLGKLLVERSPGDALRLLELTWEELTLPKRLDAIHHISSMASVLLENEEMEDRLVRVLLAPPKEAEPSTSGESIRLRRYHYLSNEFIGPRQPFADRRRIQEQNIETHGEWRVFPLVLDPLKIPGEFGYSRTGVLDIRNSGFRPGYSNHPSSPERPEALVSLPCGVVVGSHLVQESLGLARMLPFTGTDYAQLGSMLYIARRNAEPAWLNLETGENGTFALEEGLPTKAFSTCRVLDEDHILWSGYLDDPATGKTTPRRAVWRVGEKKWIRLANQEDMPEPPSNPPRAGIRNPECSFQKTRLWQGRVVYPGARKAIAPLTGETVDLGWVMEQLPPSPAVGGQEAGPGTFTRTESGWLAVRGNTAGLVEDNQKLLWRLELPGKPSRAWVGDKWVWFEFNRISNSARFLGAKASKQDLPIAAVSLADGALAGPFTLKGTEQIGRAAAAPEGLWIDCRLDMWPMGMDPGPWNDKVWVSLIPNPRKLDREGIKELAEALPMQTAAARKTIPRREWNLYAGKPWQDPIPEMVTLAGRGTLPNIKKAIQKGVPVSEGTITGWTPLMAAAQRGDPEIVRELLARGADPDQPMINGWTPVAEALMWENYGIAALLVKAGAPFSHNHINVFPQDRRGEESRDGGSYYAPSWMLRHSDEEAFIALLDRFENPLSWLDPAISQRRTKILGHLVATHGGKMTEDQLVNVAVCAWRADAPSAALAAVRLLPDPNRNLVRKEQAEKTPYRPILGIALETGDIESLKNLVDRGARLTAPLDNERGKDQAYTMAVATKNPEAVRLVSRAGARTDLPLGLGSDGGEALYQAVLQTQSWPMIEALLEAGITPLSKNRAGLVPADWRKFDMGTKSLILQQQLLAVGKVGAGPVVPVANLDFILHDDEQAARAWLSTKPSMGYEYKLRDTTSCTPLSAAIMENSEKYARLFLAAGADPNGIPRSNSQMGRTYLMEAAAAGRLELLKVLVEGGAALRKRDKFMATARHLAANEECARYLRGEETLEREGEKLMRIMGRAKYNNKTYKREYDNQAIIAQIRAFPGLLLAPLCQSGYDQCFYWNCLLGPSGSPEPAVDWVQAAGVDFNRIQSRTGELCLVQAVERGYEGQAKILLKCGASPETRGRDGRNALSALDTVRDEKVRARLRELLTQKPAGGS